MTDSIMKADLAGVEKVIAELISDTPDLIRQMLDHLLGVRGKMLRPMMLILAGRYGEFDPERHYALAASVEMLHNATLVHDDIIDDAPTRRGIPALHTLHGSKLSILVGDYLFSTCFVLAANNSNIGHYDSLAKAVARICEGEILQDTGKFIFDSSIRNYRRKIASKTAVLFALSLYLGAKEARCSDDVCSIFVRIGYDIGMAFQIIDDILDFNSDSGTIGKPSKGHDVAEGIYTLPLTMALKEDLPELERLISKSRISRRTRRRIVDIVNNSQGINRARAEAELYTDRALREISRLEDGYTKEQLILLTRRLLGRKY